MKTNQKYNPTEEEQKYLTKNEHIYLNKDNRLRVYIPGRSVKSCFSYPKYLMEQVLDKKLESDDHIHHIDGNPLNNNIQNLKVMKLKEHKLYHDNHKQNHKEYNDEKMICPICGTEFIWTGDNKKDFIKRAKLNRILYVPYQPCCSKRCTGILTIKIQKDYKKYFKNNI